MGYPEPVPRRGGPGSIRASTKLGKRPLALPGIEPRTAMQGTLMQDYLDWLTTRGFLAEAEHCANYAAASPVGASVELPGPVGESNVYRLEPRGTILCLPETLKGLLLQVGAVLATGNEALVAALV